MKKFYFILIIAISLILFSIPTATKASHISAGFITYTYVGNSGGNNIYEVTLHFYRDCVGIQAPSSPTTITYSSSCGGGGTISATLAAGSGQPVTQSPCVPPQLTTCNGGTAYGVEEYIYSGLCTLAIGCADWKFSFQLNARNAAITTGASNQSFYVETILNNLYAPTNNSPVFSSAGISEFCVNNPVIWNQFAVDPEGDSLAYSLVCAQQSFGTPVTYNVPLSCTTPIYATVAGVNINSNTGQLSFTPNQIQIAVIAVQVDEYRGGVYIGSVTRDLQLNVVGGCVPGAYDNAWLGYNNNWDDPINWCLGVPTLASNAVVRSVGGPGYDSPIIKDGVVASAKTLKIYNNDSVTIDAPVSGSLTLADSLQNDASLIVRGAFDDGVKIGPGTGVNNQMTPFRGNRVDARMQIFYTAAELSSNRLLPGDQIYELDFEILRRRSLDPYSLFYINYYETNASNFPIAGPLASVTSGPTQVYFNAAESLLGLPYNSLPGTHTITLNTPIIWSGGNIVLEICFNDFNVNPGAGADIMVSTKTTAIGNTVLLLEETAPSNGFTSNGCFLTAGGTVTATIADDRPNITFKFHRDYSQYPLTIGGSWLNNGTFEAGDSKVIFNNITADQYILGSSITTFDDIEVNKNNFRLVQGTSANVDSTINLISGTYILNRNTLSLNYSSPSAISSTSGYIISEDLPPLSYGIVKWNIGNTLAAFTVPFGNAFGTQIPVTLTTNTGDFGDIEFSTYKTNIANNPYPIGVTGIPYQFGEMVDRFWTIDRSTTGVIDVDLKLSYDMVLEEASLNQDSLKQILSWDGANWDVVLAPRNAYATIGSRREVTRSGITQFGTNWSIGSPNPLPVELLTFDGEARDNHNYIWWVTATELNTDRFEIEKSTDLIHFESIGSVKAKGFSITDQYYDLRDDKPVHGIQYYRLKSIDFDGSYEYSKPIAIYYGKESTFSIVSLIPYIFSNKISIDFLYSSNKDLNIVITDLLGKTIYQEVYSKTEGNNHHVELDVDLSSALYFVTFYNDDLKVTKKFAF